MFKLRNKVNNVLFCRLRVNQHILSTPMLFYQLKTVFQHCLIKIMKIYTKAINKIKYWSTANYRLSPVNKNNKIQHNIKTVLKTHIYIMKKK